jgi:hypothetical protein
MAVYRYRRELHVSQEQGEGETHLVSRERLVAKGYRGKALAENPWRLPVKKRML